MMVLNAATTISGNHALTYVARNYNASFFHQSWDLFVPPPNTNYKLFATFESNGIKKKEIFGEILLQHQSNRLNGYEPLIVCFSNCITFFEQSTDLQDPINHVVNDLHFTMIETASKNYLQSIYKAKISNLKLILITEDARIKRQRIYFN